MQEVIDRLVDHIQWQLRDHWKNPTFENQRKAIREGLAIVHPYLEVAEKAVVVVNSHSSAFYRALYALRAAVDKLPK